MFNLNETLKAKLSHFLRGFSFNEQIPISNNETLLGVYGCAGSCTGSCTGGCAVGCTGGNT